MEKTMIILRIYALVWAFVLVAVGLNFIESFDEITLHIFGFIFSTLLVTGFIVVLPVWMDQYFAPKTYSAARLGRISKRQQLAKARSARNIDGRIRNVT
jgi:uncharacterized membrane protein required for colicin V production